MSALSSESEFSPSSEARLDQPSSQLEDTRHSDHSVNGSSTDKVPDTVLPEPSADYPSNHHQTGTGLGGVAANGAGTHNAAKHNVAKRGTPHDVPDTHHAAPPRNGAPVASRAAHSGALPPVGSSTMRDTPVDSVIRIEDYSGSTYSDGDYRWNKGTYSRPQRFIDIWSFVLKLLSKRWLYGKAWSYGGTITPEKQTKRRQEMAVWIRETCLSLGPTFIKIGQLFSTRADLFPIEYVEELSKLQDRVPAFSYEKVRETIETDFGRPLAELYQRFDPVPIAAASLGQVHCAQLHSGEEVVVKIQRPGLSRLFEIDLSILKGIAQYFQNHREW
ncbi:MAG: AarF/UbiB family protein, partial [Cyanobacteria bacterium J06554_3]